METKMTCTANALLLSLKSKSNALNNECQDYQKEMIGIINEILQRSQFDLDVQQMFKKRIKDVSNQYSSIINRLEIESLIKFEQYFQTHQTNVKKAQLFSEKENSNVPIETTMDIFKCEKCGRMFTSKSSLNRHQIKDHGGIIQPLHKAKLSQTVIKKKCSHSASLMVSDNERNSSYCDSCKIGMKKSNYENNILMWHCTGCNLYDLCNGCFNGQNIDDDDCDSDYIPEMDKSANMNAMDDDDESEYGIIKQLCIEEIRKEKIESAPKNYCKKLHAYGGHMSIAHRAGVPLKIFRCDVANCGKVLSSSVSLRNHKLLHAKVRPFKCTLCPSSFVNRPGLHCHLRLVHSVNAWKCDECELSFRLKRDLKEHKATKHGFDYVKKFKCDECGKQLSSKRNLNYHLAHVHKRQLLKHVHKVKEANHSLTPSPNRDMPILPVMEFAESQATHNQSKRKLTLVNADELLVQTDLIRKNENKQENKMNEETIDTNENEHELSKAEFENNRPLKRRRKQKSFIINNDNENGATIIKIEQ